MNVAKELNKLTIGGEEYYFDLRLKELRNVNNPHDVKPLTCRDCPEEEICPLAYDPYNTDGDCLMMK
jgi:hypothetical protein